MALVTVVELLLKLPLMHRQQLKKKASRPISSSVTNRLPRDPHSYLKTRIRGSRLLNAARLLVLVEITQRLHQAYRYAYDKQAADRLLPQNPTPTPTPPHQQPPHQDECSTYLANGRKDLYLICRGFYSTFGNGQRINRYSDCLQTHFGRSRSGRIGAYNGPTLPASQALGGAVLPLEALYGPTLHTTCLGSLF